MLERINRRRMLGLALAVPATAAAWHLGAAVVGLLAWAIEGGIRAARPVGAGTTATRCAQCGSSEHTMLDPGCPLAPRVLG